jgi:thioredoxin
MNLTEFQQIIAESKKPVVVDFWAVWCAPCRMTKPILDKLALQYQETVEFVPVNTDESPEVAKHFRIMGIPTVLALRDGEVVSRVTGAQNEAAYGAMFEALAEGEEIKIPMSTLSRMIRLGAGGLFLLYAISSSNWLAALAGGVLIFLGVYDRCPVWKALTGMFQRKFNQQAD